MASGVAGLGKIFHGRGGDSGRGGETGGQSLLVRAWERRSLPLANRPTSSTTLNSHLWWPVASFSCHYHTVGLPQPPASWASWYLRSSQSSLHWWRWWQVCLLLGMKGSPEGALNLAYIFDDFELILYLKQEVVPVLWLWSHQPNHNMDCVEEHWALRWGGSLSQDPHNQRASSRHWRVR